MDPKLAFEALDLRVGRVLRCEINEKARKSAYKLWIDFGELGTKTSSAQLTTHYRPEDLVDNLVIGAVNLGTVRIAGFESEVLVLGADAPDGGVIVLRPDRDVPLGQKIY